MASVSAMMSSHQHAVDGDHKLLASSAQTADDYFARRLGPMERRLVQSERRFALRQREGALGAVAPKSQLLGLELKRRELMREGTDIDRDEVCAFVFSLLYIFGHKCGVALVLDGRLRVS